MSKTTKVNKEITQSLRKSQGEFFFLHNGITAICSSLAIKGDVLHVEGLSVVNGCQSLTAIYGSSEAVKKSGIGFIVFKFYEIKDTERADKISTSTNSQNGVKARDLCSNDRYVLALKKAYEQCYPDGQIITKRGESAGRDKNHLRVIELGTLGKMLISWHLQKPTATHVEASVFDDNFKLLFHRQYTPENVQALNELYRAVFEMWKPQNGNPLEFNDELFKYKAYAPYWHLFAVSVLLCEINKAQIDNVPEPEAALKVITDSGTLEDVIRAAGDCVDNAFMKDADDAHENGRIFNPPNWFKSGKSIPAVRSEVRDTLKNRKRDEVISGLKEKLKMSKRDFELRWGAE